MTNRIVLYGAPSSLSFTFEVYDEDGGFVTSYPSSEIAPSTGRYYVDLPGSLAVGIYEVLVKYNSDYIGQLHIHWDGTNILDEGTIAAKSVWSENPANFITPGTMGYVQSLISTLYKYENNRTKVDPNNHTLTIYDNDGTTPLKVFNLRDFSSQPSYVEVAEKVPQ